MARRKPRRKPLGTIWEIPDELWRRIEPILKEFWPKKPTGRRVANWRKMLNAIIFRMRSGCQWDQLPERFGPKSTVHDWFQRWVEGGIFEKIWAVLVAECDELGGVQWQWQSRPTRCWARPGSGGKKTGKNPTDRGKKGTKKSLLTDGDGGPLGVVIAGANVVEQKLLKATIEAIVVERPDPDGGGAAPVPGQGVRQPQRSRGGDRRRVTSRTSGGSARRRRRATGRRGTSRVAGWWSGRSPGCRSAVASWCGTRRRTATTWA